ARRRAVRVRALQDRIVSQGGNGPGAVHRSSGRGSPRRGLRCRQPAGAGRDVLDRNTVVNVLVIEDEELIAAFVEKGLRAHGYGVVWVRNWREGLERAAGTDISLV